MDKLDLEYIFILFTFMFNNSLGQNFVDIEYRIYNQGWANVMTYVCDQQPLILREPGVILYIDPQQSSLSTCVCQASVLSEPGSHSKTDVRVWRDPNADIDIYPTSEWSDPAAGILDFEIQSDVSTQLGLLLRNGKRHYTAPITIYVAGDFELICHAKDSTTSTTNPSTTRYPSDRNHTAESAEQSNTKDTSFLMMQVTLAAILSIAAVALVTLAVVMLCCYRQRRKNRDLNSVVTEKVLPQQSFMNVQREKYSRQYSNVTDINTTSTSGSEEHLYDNNGPTENKKSKRKTLSFRDTMYANFTAIVAAFGQARENSLKAKTQTPAESKPAPERRIYVNVEPLKNNQITDGTQYAQIDISRLVDADPKLSRTENVDENRQLEYTDLML